MPTLAQGTEKKADQRCGQLWPGPGCSSGQESRSPRSLRPLQLSHPGPGQPGSGPPGLPGGEERSEGTLCPVPWGESRQGPRSGRAPMSPHVGLDLWSQPCALLPSSATWATPDRTDSEPSRGRVSAALCFAGAGQVARGMGLPCSRSITLERSHFLGVPTKAAEGASAPHWGEGGCDHRRRKDPWAQ